MNTEKQGFDHPPPYDSQLECGIGYPRQVGYQPLSTGPQTGNPQSAGYQPWSVGQQTGYQPVPTIQQTSGPIHPGQQATVYQPYGSPYPQPPYQQSMQPPGQSAPRQQVVIVQPGYPQGPVVNVIPGQTRPDSCIVPAIFVCLFCFCPTGICAIYYATRANQLLAEGNTTEAQMMSQKARNLVIASIAIGVILIIFWFIMRVVLNRF